MKRFQLLPLVCMLAFVAGCSATPGKKTHFQQGVELFDAGDFSEAAHEFDLAIAEDPKDQKADFNLGLSFLKQEEYGRAIAAYQEYNSRFPEDSEAHINLAFAFAGKGEDAQAIRHFEQAIALNKTYPYPYSSYASWQLSKNTTTANRKAEDLLIEATDLGRRDSTAHYLLGVAQQRLANEQGARKAFAHAVDLDANNQPALVKLADYQCKDGKYADASLHYIRAGVLRPDDFEAYLGAGLCFRELGNYVKSMQALWKAKGLAPEDARVDRELVLCSLAMLTAGMDRLLNDVMDNGLSEQEQRQMLEELNRLQSTSLQWKKILGD